MIRQFKIYNSRGDMIDLTNNGDFLAFNPQGLGVSFSNGFYGANANYLQNGLSLDQKQLELMMMFGHKSQDGYKSYFEFIKFLNHTPYLIEYETSAGVFHRECVLSELTKTELKEEQTLQENFTLDFTTPYFKTVSNKTVIVPPIEGKAGKIYETATRKRQVFETVPESYQEGDLWHWNGEDYPGRNLLLSDTVTVGRFLLETNGSLGNSGAHSTSDFIPVQSATTYSLSTKNKLYQVRVVYYNSSKTYISGILMYRDQGVSKVITTPLGTAYIRVSSDFLNGDSLSMWIIEDLTGGQSSGYFIATKSSNEFNFNDFVYYGQSANKNTYYDKIYDYTYSFDDYPVETEESYYTYDYIYDGYEDGKDGVFIINNESVYMDSSIGSPCEIIVRGPAMNPHWQIVQGSKIVQSDGFNLDIPEGYRLVVSSIPQEQRAVLIGPDGTMSNVWQQQDFSKTNFVTFPIGKSKIIFFNCKQVEFNYREESVVV